jgi:serine/threonine protein kinase/tetratricopeptide (TPR) repeat protein
VTPDPSEFPDWRTDVITDLGRGGFASVWDVGNNRVLKVAHADHELARARIAREAEALAAINKVMRGAVPAFYAHGVTGGRAWIEMEKVEGENLGNTTLNGGVRADRAVTITLALLDSLVAVHAAGFAHRDLKPDNLVRKKDGSVVILDLGIARKLPTDPDDPTRAGMQVGSLEYMPPEQAIDSSWVDARSDVYAVGCILFELCTARPPFVGDVAALERAHAALRPPRMSELAAVPLVLEVVVADCLAKERAKRPQSALDLRTRLQATRDTPSLARSVPQLSQVTEAKQPVVLVWAELPKVDRTLLGQFSARKVLVLSQRGRRILGALLGSSFEDPASTALELAHDLTTAGARVACHLDALLVDPSGATPTLTGESVENIESWLPSEPFAGTLLTRAFAAVVQVPTRPSPLGAAYRTLAAGPDQDELVGRDALLVDLSADAAAALRGGPSALERSNSGAWTPMGPAFDLLYGDPGTGKSVFAAELARRIGELGAQVIVAALPAPGMARNRGALDELLGAAKSVREIGDALRDQARKKPLAVILDDLHYADHDLLEALEYATLGGEPLPLWILGIADPRLDVRRPKLGTRAERHRKDVLGPLDEEAAVELATRLLAPAEYPPLRAVRQLVGLAHRNPLHLTMLAREIHERGAIKQRPGSTEHFLDTSALETLEPIALGPWTASRATANLAPELVALARMCAIVGAPIDTKELAAVIAAVEETGGATVLVDPEVGIRELIAAHILVATPDGAAFRQPLVEEGLYATTDDAQRKAIHAGALQTLPADADPARVARHAEAVGAAQVAATAFTHLGEIAEREHKPIEAADAWAGALRNLSGPGAARALALIGRARALMRLQRPDDAIAALDETIAIATAIGAGYLHLEALLETAIVCDLRQDFPRMQQATRDARAHFTDLAATDAALGVRVAVAEARVVYRDQRMADAAPLLRSVLAEARALHLDEPETIAGLLLGCTLSDLGEVDEAERVFDELIASCTRRDDAFHLAAAYGNRAWLWSARGAVERTADDLRHASRLARESGQAFLERGATHNLAEQLMWTGDLDEALALARRSLSLQQQSGEPTGIDRVLVARVLAARGDIPALREVLTTFSGDDAFGENDAAHTQTLRVLSALANNGDTYVWKAALADTGALYAQLRLELWHLASVHGQLPSEMREQALVLAAADPLWRRRVGELEAV